MSIARTAGATVGGFLLGAIACFLFAAVDLFLLKGDYLSQLPFSYAASAFAGELWSNWSLAIAIGVIGAVIGFLASLARRPTVPGKARKTP